MANSDKYKFIYSLKFEKNLFRFKKINLTMVLDQFI